MKFFIGLLIGIGIAGGVAYYLNKAQNPFVDKGFNQSATQTTSSSSPVSSTPLVLAPGTTMQQASSSPQVAPSPAAAKANASTPSYDFYDVLQGKKNINPKPSASKAVVRAGYFVQAGAFSDSDLANNMKAKLALLGISAKIVATEENNAIINKVLIGPFNDTNQAQSMVDQLNQQSINATMVTPSSQPNNSN
jgi:cell division protein FtsN